MYSVRIHYAGFVLHTRLILLSNIRVIGGIGKHGISYTPVRNVRPGQGLVGI